MYFTGCIIAALMLGIEYFDERKWNELEAQDIAIFCFGVLLSWGTIALLLLYRIIDKFY